MGRKLKPRKVRLESFPHNGDGRPDLQFPDYINGEMIGGQVALMRMAMRKRHLVAPWARRQGKTRARQFLLPNEATITPGPYYAGICFPDHTTAAKIAEVFRTSWGDMVKDSKINDKDQDRWIQLHPFVPPSADPPTWFTPRLAKRWTSCYHGKHNTSVRVYFWGAAHPHYEKIQGFPHPFHRIDWDECQQIHPNAYGIVRPMLRDVRGHECFTGTPWSSGIGNVQFEKFWTIAGSNLPGWFRMRIPDGTSPLVAKTPMEEAKISMTDREIAQTMYAMFLSGEGALFTNLDAVFTLKPLRDDDPSSAWAKDLRSRFAMPSTRSWIYRPEPDPTHVYGASVDWARSPKGDYSVLTVFDLSTAEQIALFRWRGEDFTAQMEVVLAVQKHYHATQLHSDDVGMGLTMSDFMRRRHALGFVGHRFSASSKSQYVRQTQVLFSDAAFHLIDCPEQRNEFKNFSAFEHQGIGSEKTIHYCAPEGEHDDFVSATMQIAPTITVLGRQQKSPPDPIPDPVFTPEGKTTLEKFYEDHPSPWKEPADMSWQDVVIPT